MATMIPIPDDLTNKLRAKADERRIPLNDLVVDILADAMAEDEAPTLEAAIAHIQATPSNPANFEPASASLADGLAHSASQSAFDSEAWQREWNRVESEMKARDRADDVAEGRE